LAKAPEEETFMKQSKFPKGWDEAKVSRVLASCEDQTEEEAAAGDEAANLRKPS
jgi:hypothetical protein